MKRKHISFAAGAAGIAAGFMAGNKFRKKYSQIMESSKKLGSYYHVLNKWLLIHQNGSSLVPYFVDNEYKSIAIYGYKELGERLYDELKTSEINVKYIIDWAADNIYAEVDAYLPDDVLDDVDVVIVTASYYFEEIKKMLNDKLDCPIVPIDDVVVSMFQK